MVRPPGRQALREPRCDPKIGAGCQEDPATTKGWLCRALGNRRLSFPSEGRGPSGPASGIGEVAGECSGTPGGRRVLNLMSVPRFGGFLSRGFRQQQTQCP